MPIQLLEAICKLFNCSPIALTEILNHPAASIRIQDFLQNKQIRTNYINRDERKKEVLYSRLSLKNASTQHAYEGYLNVSVSVQAYFSISACVYNSSFCCLGKSPLLLPSQDQTPTPATKMCCRGGKKWALQILFNRAVGVIR